MHGDNTDEITKQVNLSLLKPVQLKAVERVYGDHGAEMLEHLKRAPRVAIGIVLVENLESQLYSSFFFFFFC